MEKFITHKLKTSHRLHVQGLCGGPNTLISVLFFLTSLPSFVVILTKDFEVRYKVWAHPPTGSTSLSLISFLNHNRLFKLLLFPPLFFLPEKFVCDTRMWDCEIGVHLFFIHHIIILK